MSTQTEKTVIENFNQLPLAEGLLQVVSELGFATLTPIQAQSIPPLLEGRDLLGQSKTGSGKTAAFALPLLQKIDVDYRQIQALVLCPTRELCAQVAREIRKFGRRLPGLNVLVLSGGQSVRDQVKVLEKGVHIIVGTPGRLLDHLNRKTLDLEFVSTLILDEADRMFDMGFKDEIEKVLEAVPQKRQTIFFSATYPSSIAAMSRKFQTKPVKVVIEDESAAIPDIIQKAIEVDFESKLTKLFLVLQQHNPESVLIFCNLKVTVDELAEALFDEGVSVDCLHGDMEQSDRDRVIAKFRNQSTRVLVATDVAARGLDIKDLDIVINFDLPPSADVYVHRIGRTGRAGQKGLAVSFVNANEWGRVENIQQHTAKKIEKEILELGTPIEKNLFVFQPKMETLFIAGGRKDKMRPGDILGALTGEAGGLDGSDVGKIEIYDKFAYVAVSKSVAAHAFERLSQGRIKGRKVRVEKVK